MIPWAALGAFVLAAVVATIHTVAILAAPPERLLGHFGALPSPGGSQEPTKSALADMAIATGLAVTPPLWVVPGCDAVNACVVGLDPRRSVVGVTSGFVERLSQDDQRAVFANLMARLRDGDVLWATAVASVMGPVWGLRDSQLASSDTDVSAPRASGAGAGGGLIAFFILAFLGLIMTELLMAGHQRACRAAAEKADAEGMLLLKDPMQMLNGLSRVLYAGNTVHGAGEAYSMLFYCWAGFGYAPEDDPEMERIPRLREVLGAQGLATSDWVAPQLGATA